MPLFYLPSSLLPPRCLSPSPLLQPPSELVMAAWGGSAHVRPPRSGVRKGSRAANAIDAAVNALAERDPPSTCTCRTKSPPPATALGRRRDSDGGTLIGRGCAPGRVGSIVEEQAREDTAGRCFLATLAWAASGRTRRLARPDWWVGAVSSQPSELV